MSIETRVARGARFLDETLPGWAGMIEVPSISLTSSDDCILGQLNRRDHRLRAIKNKNDLAPLHFNEALRKMGFRFGQKISFMFFHGFEVGSPKGARQARARAAWRAEIAQRLPKPERKPRPLYVKDHWSAMEEYLAQEARRSSHNYISV